jgi:hypothetical protein
MATAAQQELRERLTGEPEETVQNGESQVPAEEAVAEMPAEQLGMAAIMAQEEARAERTMCQERATHKASSS